jgi:hypothetical protein
LQLNPHPGIISPAALTQFIFILTRFAIQNGCACSRHCAENDLLVTPTEILTQRPAMAHLSLTNARKFLNH